MAIAKTKKELLQDIVNDYIDEVNPDSYEMTDVAMWAIANDRWDEPPESKVRRCAQQLSDAAREEYHTDKKGRRVRSKCHYQVTTTAEDGTKKQKHLWADLRSLTPRQARLSFGQRRKQIEGECIQLSNDVDSYNDENIHGDKYQMDFDFTYCIEEASGSGEYDPS